MAEALGVASGLVALVTFAFQSASALHTLIDSFQSHQRRVCDLSDEVHALMEVLRSLTETMLGNPDLDCPALKFPLLRCGRACNEFEEEILNRCKRTKDGRNSFRDWVKLKYLGENIDGFRRILSGYKQTIGIAVADANLRQSCCTAERLDDYNKLLKGTKADLEERLEIMKDKLDDVGHSPAESDADAHEVQRLKEEWQSTEKCLQICAQLSDQISELQRTEMPIEEETSYDDESLSSRVEDNDLRECKDYLSRLATKLEDREEKLLERFLDKAQGSAKSTEDLADLKRLRDDWKATCESRSICAKAQQQVNDSVSRIENEGTGEVLQFMVSTKDKPIRGKNRGDGVVWQFGGHMDDESLQQFARAISGFPGSRLSGDRETTPARESQHEGAIKSFGGKGHKLGI